jgi:hypothetical protein
MKLNKNTQIILGVGALAVVGYFVWKSTQKDDTKKMVGATGYKRRKRNASGEANFQSSVNIPCQFMVAQTDWKVVGNYNGETLYLDNKGIYHWFTRVSGKVPKTNQMTTYCYENTSSGNPLKFTPKK